MEITSGSLISYNSFFVTRLARLILIEKGIRHPLLDNAKAEVDEADALFMIGACAAFVSYMINKARLAGVLDRKGAAT